MKNVLIDVDGVLWQGGKQIKGAQNTIGFLEKNGYNYLLLTNISRYTKSELCSQLEKTGIRVSAEKIITPLESTIEFIKAKKQNATCYLIAENGIKKQFQKSGLKVTQKDSGADFVVVFLYEKTNYKMLGTAFRNLLAGAKLISNSDLKSMAFLDKKPSIATGAFVKALEYCSGKKAFLTGKPGAAFFRLALKKLKARKNNTVMVGDSLSIDIAGAKSIGIKAVLVKTGNYSEKELKKSTLKPDAVIGSIARLPQFLSSQNPPV